jgi:hypothetical protein
MSQENLEVVRELISAVNDRDLDQHLAHHPDGQAAHEVDRLGSRGGPGVVVVPADLSVTPRR